MQRYNFDINPLLKHKIFIRINSKIDIIKIWMELIKYITVTKINTNSSDLIIIKNRMQRVFIIKEHQILSLNFPFNIKAGIEENKIYFESIELDSEITTDILQIIECDEFESMCSIDLLEPLYCKEENNPYFWQVLKKLLILDSGYIRYDYDTKNFKPESPHLHPLNHYDIFYAQSSTLKLGVENKLDINNFIDSLDTSTNSHYVMEIK